MWAMGLHDHFRPPLSQQRHWHAFHNGWASTLAAALNEKLPPRYFAEPNVQFGVEIDVATFGEGAGTEGVATAIASATNATATWAPPAPTRSVPFPLTPDTVEVVVYANEGGPVLAGAIELVSPSNKDRLTHREAFVSKCETYLHQGVGLVIVDVVTDRSANLHEQLLDRIAPPSSTSPTPLYATAYRPVERGGQPSIDLWEEALALQKPLPTMPLWLRGELCLPVELEATYQRTCREQRISG
jgi:hypothetical protein